MQVLCKSTKGIQASNGLAACKPENSFRYQFLLLISSISYQKIIINDYKLEHMFVRHWQMWPPAPILVCFHLVLFFDIPYRTRRTTFESLRNVRPTESHAKGCRISLIWNRGQICPFLTHNPDRPTKFAWESATLSLMPGDSRTSRITTQKIKQTNHRGRRSIYPQLSWVRWP